MSLVLSRQVCTGLSIRSAASRYTALLRPALPKQYFGETASLSFPSTSASRCSATARHHRCSTKAMGRTALDEMAKDGEFKRKDAVFRSWIEEGGKFAPEANRYHLYISLACPWASRCLAVMYLKGLEDVIGLSVTHPTWQKTKPDNADDKHTGWTFVKPGDPPLSSSTGFGSFPCDDRCIPDTVNGAKYVRDLYELANDTEGKYTVPVLWDKQERTIVSNESADIVRMLDTRFNKFAKYPERDLRPKHLEKEIDAVNEWIYPTINNGVYRAGFATSQKAYETAFGELFESLERAEQILSKQRYIAGDVLTEADIRLFCTLIRFDHVYVVYFKTNKKFIHQFPNLADYTRELYQEPEIKRSVSIAHIKTHYFTSHPTLNYYSVIPVGPPMWFEEPHSRDRTAFFQRMIST